VGLVSLYFMVLGVQIGDDQKELMTKVLENGDIFITGVLPVVMAFTSKLRE